jgi:hypothetical protein
MNFIIGSFLITGVLSARAAETFPFISLVNDHTGLTWTKRSGIDEGAIGLREKQLLDLQKPDQDPYWGTMHVSPTCDRTKLPPPKRTTSDRETVETLQMFATARRNLGLCSEKLDVLKVQVALLYCKADRSLYEIHYFFDRARDWPSHPVARCP